MEAPVQWDIKTELKKIAEMIPWLQRGNLQEISFKPNHPAVIVYRSIVEAAGDKPVTIRLVKRGHHLFLVCNELEINALIQTFRYDSVADKLMGYLLDRRPGEKVSLDDMSGIIGSTEIPVNEAFRKIHHREAFHRYFVPICTKHTMQVVDRIIMSPEESKKLLQDFEIKWQDPE